MNSETIGYGPYEQADVTLATRTSKSGHEMQTFKQVASTTQSLYACLVQATASSSSTGNVPADVAEILHSVSKLLATAAHRPEAASQAFAKLVGVCENGDYIFNERYMTTTQKTSEPMEQI